jgi:CobQ-like glutamine amidotransferase family enzyme
MSRPTDSTVNICLLLPDVLGTYSDSGNATVLLQRLRWRDIPARILTCTAVQNPPTSCDIYVLGGGEDTAQRFAARWLRDHRALRNTLADTAVTLAVCAGLQIFGRTMTDPDGTVHLGADLLDLTTCPGRRRATGQITTHCHLPGVGQLCGFENHRGATTLGPGLRPLGRVLTGIGNTGNHGPRIGHRTGRGDEGVLTDRIIGTYMHGPVLARNPALADHILTRATGHHLAPLELPDQAQQRRTYLPDQPTRRFRITPRRR